ncbi:C6 zinc finger domain-containing protein [Histoplasma capsulatum G186AR]|uniref:C6 zinc finger domain-containing protein n=2 Tax=Ajellomyces capsulatus TaxID=5037 RepID=A0A8H7YEL8_AJECA|nr:C6 zinc finger domain-containing protein [Histoplasma capsulatum]QSS72907.1 C6 zinc finger domain-containing protein [Histoplasma capsulatum G186AR]
MGMASPNDPQNSQPQFEKTQKQTARKKFAKPPVKVACLSCRASRIRCDGKETCSGCASKGKECCYLPSKRGGPRKKKVGQSSGLGLEPFPDPSLQEAVFVQFDSLAVPGAGLRHLDFPPQDQSMFDSLRVPASGDVSPPALAAEPTSNRVPSEGPSRVRVYGNEDDILNGYYIFIHQYFPIFPPAHSPITIDRPLDFPGKSSNQKLGMDTPLGYIPKSPISLAISAILALVPHPKDLKPSSPESVRLRRSYAQWFSRASLESVETESEIAESGANPSQALLNEHPIPKRPSLHPHVPVELEAILALLILSVYEYAQRGNLVKMRHRAGQAFVTAMNMSLHALPPEDSIYAEARRRAWWMTYYSVCQGSIVSTTRPTIIPNDPRFVTPYPNFASDPDCWPLLMRAQHALIAGTQFIIDLNQTLKSRGDMSYIYERMKKIDAWIRPVLAQANTAPPVSPVSGITDSEAITAQSIRKICLIKLSSALIKTHRFRAFLDIPIFIKKHCDLTCASIGYLATEADAQGSSKHCCADTSLYDIPPIPLPGQSPSSCSTTSDISGPTTSSSTWVDQDSFPFTNQQSTEICLTSALTIAHMFHTLPYPVPVYGDKDLLDLSSRAQSPSHELSAVAPRTMPSFACCAMQSSYAMLMLYYKSRVVDQNIYVEGRPLNFSEELTEELQYGLECVISAVRNYSRVFEALDGMREEIESAFMMAFAQVQ